MSVHNNTPNRGTRVEWVDVAKCIAIILVVMGHASFPEQVRAGIYAFHMPLFFTLSGLFLSAKDDFRTFVKKKARSLLIPYFWFNLILIAFFTIFGCIGGPSINPLQSLIGMALGLRIGWECHGYLWFLPCLFLCEVLMYFILKVPKWIAIGLVVVCAAVGALWICTFDKSLPFSLDLALIAVGFVALGSAYKRHQITPPLAISAVALAFFGWLNYRWLGGRNVDMYEGNMGNYLYFYSAAVAGTFVVIAISKKFRPSSWILFLGRNTLAIYGLHVMFVLFVQQVIKYTVGFSTAFWPMLIRASVMTVVVIALCIPLCKVVDRYFPWMLGKRKKIL